MPDDDRRPEPEGALATFFSYGFRPFFLFAALDAVVVMGLFLFWMGIHQVGGEVTALTISIAPFQWHAHEMLFGFTLAVICGFFLTAVPNWTGSRAVSGPPLMLLAGAWLAGRLAMGFAASLPPLLVAAADLALIPLLLPLVIAAMARNWSKRNFVFLPILAALFAANLLCHLDYMGMLANGAARGQMLALDIIVLLIAIIGGRVVPAFTTNALRKRGIEDLPAGHPAANGAGIILVALLAVADQVAPDHAAVGVLSLAAAAANGWRLSRWKGLRTLGEPIVLILHVGFAWLVLGLALKGLAVVAPNAVGPVAALHALTAGAIGTMTLAIMSRAALGHTGRPLIVGGATVAAYGLVTLGAGLRVAVPLWLVDYYGPGMIVAGVAWTAAFALFLIVYWPVLTGPRALRAE